jgi:hypothetical protein
VKDERPHGAQCVSMIENLVFNDYAVRLNLDSRLLRNRASAEQLKEKLRQDLIRKYNIKRPGSVPAPAGKPEVILPRQSQFVFVVPVKRAYRYVWSAALSQAKSEMSKYGLRVCMRPYWSVDDSGPGWNALRSGPN